MENHPLISDELIGRPVEVVACTDPTWVGRTGIIIDETKNTFLIDTGEERKRIAKHTATFAIEYEHKKTIIKGILLRHRPEERVKRLR